MAHYDERKKRIEVFEDTVRMYESDSELKAAVKQSIVSQTVYKEGSDLDFTARDTEATVIVSKKRSFEAAQAYAAKGKKTCVLNFASATNPGGGVVLGSGAQEECLCRCSTLYPALQAVYENFHGYHKELLHARKLTALYNGDCIYTPNVVVFKKDSALPSWMQRSDWYRVDVISCAAPNLREQPSNLYNPNSGFCRPHISDRELVALHQKRLVRILTVAAHHGAEVVILGAFGCGAFQNPPELVAQAAKKVVQDFRRQFEAIEFAVFCPPQDSTNYDTFLRVLL